MGCRCRTDHLQEASGGPGGMSELEWIAERDDLQIEIGEQARRIRELEAELVEARRHEREAIEAYDRQYARAEKAEARMFSDAEEILRLKDRVAELEMNWENRHAARVRELVACQARVAELTSANDVLHRKIEAREREGE